MKLGAAGVPLPPATCGGADDGNVDAALPPPAPPTADGGSTEPYDVSGALAATPGAAVGDPTAVGGALADGAVAAVGAAERGAAASGAAIGPVGVCKIGI